MERSQRFQDMVRFANEYFDLIEKENDSVSKQEIKFAKEKLDEMDMLFNDDPYFVALLKMERKTKLNQHLKR